jgi:cytochrome c551/c552
MKKIGGLFILMLFVITQANAQIYFSDVAPIIYNKCGNCHQVQVNLTGRLF